VTCAKTPPYVRIVSVLDSSRGRPNRPRRKEHNYATQN
jgi:hypothetical protein